VLKNLISKTARGLAAYVGAFVLGFFFFMDIYEGCEGADCRPWVGAVVFGLVAMTVPLLYHLYLFRSAVQRRRANSKRS
jgi:hypothetical protein